MHRLAGMCARRRSPFLCLAKERNQRKATPSLRPLRCASGQTCTAAFAGCAVELAARQGASLKQPPRVRARTRASCGARATPQTLRRRRSHRGLKTIRAIAALGPTRGRAQRWPVLDSSTPLAVPRSAGRGAGMGSAACHASCSDLLRLSERSASARSEFRSTAPRPSIAGCPQRSEGTRPVGSPFLCLLSFGDAKESECAAGRTSRPADASRVS